MNPASAALKLFRMAGVLARSPSDLPFAHRWLRSLLPGHSPLADEIPWVTWKAVNWLERTLTPDMNVFEYGAGGSTLFLARHVRHVVSVEHDEEFYRVVADILAKKKLDNCELFLRRPVLGDDASRVPYSSTSFTSAQAKHAGANFEEYVKTIDGYPDKSFDMVLVDGRARVSCVRRALPKIKPGGYLLLDNSDRPGYSEGLQLLHDYPRQDFQGIVPWNIEPYQTSVWQIR